MERRFGKTDLEGDYNAMLRGISMALARPSEEHSHAAGGMREILLQALPPMDRRKGAEDRRPRM